MAQDRAKLTVGEILRDVFSSVGIKTRKEPTLTQWTVWEHGVSKRKIDTLSGFITSLGDANYNIELQDVSVTVPKYEKFRINLMCIQATLQGNKWINISIYTDEEELPSKRHATPKDLQDRIDNATKVVEKALSFVLLIWETVKAWKGFSSS